ncbi:unnamed protein product [Urochloa decumbens]|uniref:BED-type domain-containing protein n=1 Tax=Urochloa decumbens TaxID=240449 RepID=A0ABC8YRS5_9POAL
MVGPSSPLFLPLAHSAATASPRCHEERHRTRDLTHQHLHPDPCLPTVPSDSGSPNLATEFRVGSPTDFNSPTAYAGSDGDDVEMGEADNSHHQSDGLNLSARAKTAIERATKRFRSNCWKEFEPILEDGVVVQGRCKHCDIVMAAKRGAGTSSLLTHLRRCKKRSRNLRIVQDLSSTLRSPCGSSLKDWSYDPDVSRYELMRMISLHGLPFLFLEYDGLRRFVASLNPLFKVPHRTTGRTGCLKAFHDKKLELKEMLKNAYCRFSLTTDMWTSNQTLGYIVVTCHFIDADWKLQKRIIKFIDVKTPHTGAELYNNIQNCIQDWGIEDKLFAITLDNAAANNTMVDSLKKNLVSKNLLPAKGQLLHHRCAGHVINLIVKSGLQVVEQVVVNIRESVKYIRSLVSRKQMFKEIVSQEGIASKKKPGLDITTRWNSTYLMLKTALKFRLAFEKLKSEDQKYAHAPSSDEWEKAEVLCRLLKVYKRATKVISGTQYPTSNLYFHLMWKIKITLEETSLEFEVAENETSLEEVAEDETPVEFAKVLKHMKQKFDKYWSKSYVLLCVPVVFDPRFKLKFIDFLFKDSFPTKAQLRFARVEKLVRSLFESYSSQETESTVASNRQGVVDLGLPSTRNDPWAAWDRQLNNDLQSKRSTELDRYLDEDPVPRSQEFDILKWWMGNASQYPVQLVDRQDRY